MTIYGIKTTVVTIISVLVYSQTTRPTDREMLTQLAEGGIEYEDWKYSCFPNLLDVIEQFPSLQKMDICLLLTGLPLLQTVRITKYMLYVCLSVCVFVLLRLKLHVIVCKGPYRIHVLLYQLILNLQ